MSSKTINPPRDGNSRLYLLRHARDLPIAVVAFGMAAFAIVLHLVTHHII